MTCLGLWRRGDLAPGEPRPLTRPEKYVEKLDVKGARLCSSQTMLDGREKTRRNAVRRAFGNVQSALQTPHLARAVNYHRVALRAQHPEMKSNDPALIPAQCQYEHSRAGVDGFLDDVEQHLAVYLADEQQAASLESDLRQKWQLIGELRSDFTDNESGNRSTIRTLQGLVEDVRIINLALGNTENLPPAARDYRTLRPSGDGLVDSERDWLAAFDAYRARLEPSTRQADGF